MNVPNKLQLYTEVLRTNIKQLTLSYFLSGGTQYIYNSIFLDSLAVCMLNVNSIYIYLIVDGSL